MISGKDCAGFLKQKLLPEQTTGEKFRYVKENS
jgi:hypothetical protein